LIFGHGALLARRYLHVKRPANKGKDTPKCGACPIRTMTTIGERVRHLRKKRGLSQVELAALSGITQGSLSLIERNETEMPAGDTLAGLCRALKTTPDFLVAGAGDPDSIESAIQEHELVFLWRGLPEDARRLILENAHSVRRAFDPSKAKN
jgi:transcriptional regulator with XRE-family HTH domain